MEGRSGDSFWTGAVLTCNRAGVWEFKQLDGICSELSAPNPESRTPSPARHDPGPAVWDDTPFGAGSDGPIPALEAEPLDGLVIGLGVGLGDGFGMAPGAAVVARSGLQPPAFSLEPDPW